MTDSLRRLLLGSPLPTAEELHQRLTKLQALAVFSSDALSSVAYATEEILLVLVVAGAQGESLLLPIALAIAGLLAIVAVSYYQTIHGYPSGGGAYIVAHDNLGVGPGLVAAAALLIDYVMTVAVSVTAGVAAILSAFPTLLPYRVGLCLLCIAVIAWANLRGVRESATVFAAPAYGFILIVLALILVGILRAITGTLLPIQPRTSPSVPTEIHALSALLVLRAYASGCTALTGIEAISNGVRAFRPPEADNAGKTLIAMAALLETMFLGITWLARYSGTVPTHDETVLSQLGRQVFGSGSVYLTLQAATALMLVLAANTSFADFPRLSAILARDRFLPRQLASLGDRLVFSGGILLLAVLASCLVAVFGGQTHRLIPLYAVGVFLAFTLSQSGMVRHWQREGQQGWRWKAAINGLGATATAIVLTVIVTSKIIHGAWIVVVLIPTFVWLFSVIARHYHAVAEQLSLDALEPERWAGMSKSGQLKVLVPVSGVHRGTIAALRFARSLSNDVTAVVIDVEPQITARVRERWPRWGHGVPLVVLGSPYRSTTGPLLRYVDEVDLRDPQKGLAVVVLPYFVPAQWWQDLLHNQTAGMIKRALIYQRGHTGKDRVIIDVPYHLRR
jgi:amino acid transporter